MLVLFGLATLVGSLAAGPLGGRRPTTMMLAAAGTTLVAVVALGATSTLPIPTVALFTLLGLAGLSANAILIGMVLRFAGTAPTLASALIPSSFNLGTAIGTGVTSVALDGALGTLAPIVTGTVGAVLVLVVFGTVAVLERRTRRAASAPS